MRGRQGWPCSALLLAAQELAGSLVPFATLGYALSAEAITCVWADLAHALLQLGLWPRAQLLWGSALLQGLTPERWASAVEPLAPTRRIAGKPGPCWWRWALTRHGQR